MPPGLGDIVDVIKDAGSQPVSFLSEQFGKVDDLEIVKTINQTKSGFVDLPALIVPGFLEHSRIQFPARIEGNDRFKKITYADQTKLQVHLASDGSVEKFTLRNGTPYSRDEQGRWVDSKGEQMPWNGVSLKGKTFTIQNNDGSIEVITSTGQTKRYSGERTANLALYPPPDVQQKAVERIDKLITQEGGLSEQGKTIVDDAEAIGINKVDLWHGRTVVLDGGPGTMGDGGALYRKWKELGNTEERTSSHYQDIDAQQYQIRLGPGDSVVLFGLTDDGNTWFQFERHSGDNFDFSAPGDYIEGLGELVSGFLFGETDKHNLDYQMYLALGQQSVGPFGFNDRGDLVTGILPQHNA